MEAPRCYWGIHRGAWKKHRSGVYSNQMPNPYGGAKDMAQPPIGFRGHIPAGPWVPAGARNVVFCTVDPMAPAYLRTMARCLLAGGGGQSWPCGRRRGHRRDPRETLRGRCMTSQRIPSRQPCVKRHRSARLTRQPRAVVVRSCPGALPAPVQRAANDGVSRFWRVSPRMQLGRKVRLAAKRSITYCGFFPNALSPPARRLIERWPKTHVK